MGDLTAALRETLETFGADGAPQTTSEVADALDLGRRSTYDRLDRLVDAGELRTKKVGASARVWWRNGTPNASARDETADAGAADPGTARGSMYDGATDASTSSGGASELEEGPVSSPTGFAVFANDGTLTTANERFRTLFGLDGNVSLADLEAVPLTGQDGDVIEAADRPVRRVRRTNRPVVDEHVRVETDDGHRWLSMTVRESDDGVVVTASDVTGVVERSRRLDRERDAVATEFSEFASHAVDGRLKLDEDGTVLFGDDRAATLLGASASDLVGASTSEAFEALTGAGTLVDVALASGSTQTGDCRHGNRDAWFEVEVVPTASGASVLLREVTDQVERERELQRYVGVVDALGEPVYELDREGRFAFVNDAVTELLGYSREELLGEHVSLVMPDEAVERIESQLRELSTADGPERLRSEYDVTTKRGHTIPVENRLTLLTDEAGNVRGNAGIVSDITARKERARELERYARIVETVEDGIYVLDQEDRFVVVNDAFASMAGVGREEIIGQKASIVFDDTFVERANERQAALSAGPMESAKLEGTFSPVDGEPIVVETRFTTFASEVGNSGRVGVVRDVGERVERERRIDRQRSRLEVLNEVNTVVRDVATGAIDGSSREEIETMVCERLAASNAYEFAWISELTGVDGSLVVRTAAGLDESDDASLARMLQDVRGRGAISRAFRDRTTQTVHDTSLLPTSDPWRALAARHGFQTAMAIPITHEGRMFGVLNVHSNRESAFADEERRVVEHIGEVVGHAIAAVERKRALSSEAVLELDYRVPRAFSSLNASESLAGKLTFDETVSTSGDEVLVYGTASAAAMESMESLIDDVPYWKSVTVVDTDEVGNSRFELRAEEPPVFSMVTARGGYVDKVVIVDGDSRFMLHVPPGQDVRAITEEVSAAYPSAELVAQRQVSRPQPSMAKLQDRIAKVLTDRQRAALDAAYHSGYFEWPRAATGEEVADSLGVAPPTFNQHIRKAERKVFEALLGSQATDSAPWVDDEPE